MIRVVLCPAAMLSWTAVSMIELIYGRDGKLSLDFHTKDDSLHFAIILSTAFPSLTIDSSFSPRSRYSSIWKARVLLPESVEAEHVHFFRPILGI